jgi:hypothetical protein
MGGIGLKSFPVASSGIGFIETWVKEDLMGPSMSVCRDFPMN